MEGSVSLRQNSGVTRRRKRNNAPETMRVLRKKLPTPLSPEQIFQERLTDPRTLRNLGSMALKLMGNREDAEDLVQDTIIKSIRAFNRGSYEESGSFLGWLYFVMRNAGLENLRRTKSRARVAGLIETETREAPRQDNIVLLAELQPAIGRLKTLQREIFNEVVVNEEPMDVVAFALGVALGTIKSNVHRARHRLVSFADGGSSGPKA